MVGFSNFLTEQKNTHMRHIEDKVIYGGVDGTRQAINALRALRDMLKGTHSSKVSIKYDGAPAIFCGQDPRDGKFFVAKKGIFNKDPKVYKTDAEVDADTSGDLSDKLKLALKYLPELGIKGVIQGDFLYSYKDLKKEKIDGEDYITFHPNTIVYAVPTDHHQADTIKKAKIGIVWHTTYTGKDFESMSATYGVDVSKLKTSKNVWSVDAMLKNEQSATMSAKETAEVTKHLSNAGKLFSKIASTTLKQLEQHSELSQTIETFNNSFVRKGEIVEPTTHVVKLIKYIKDKYQKEIDKRKTEKGKTTQRDKLSNILSFFSDENKIYLKYMFDLQRELVLAKLILINKLDKLQSLSTFVKTKHGFKVTGAEGYVAIDTLGNDAVKIVDRMEFSYNNFSPDTLKGWDSKSRS